MNIRQFYIRKALGFIVFIAIVGIAAFAYALYKEAKSDATTIERESNISVSPTPALLSLLLLANQEFNGRDLQLGDVQVNNEFYTKYFASYKSDELTISGVMYIAKGKGPFPVLIGYVEDVINAVEAIKKSDIPQIDKNNIGMLGHSMGGGITQQVLVTKPDLVKAAVLYAPVSSDVSDSYYRYYKKREEDEDVKTNLEDIYGNPEQNPEFWRGISPRTYFEKVRVSVAIFHGTADKDVPLEWSRSTEKILKELGKNVTLKEYPGEGHEFGLAHDDFMARSSAFFNTYLRP